MLVGYVFLFFFVNLVFKRLNLFFFGIEVIKNIILKEKIREIMKEMEMFEVNYFKFFLKDEIIKYKDNLDYLCIVKFLNGFGSINVERVNLLDDLLVLFKKYMSNFNYSILGLVFFE